MGKERALDLYDMHEAYDRKLLDACSRSRRVMEEAIAGEEAKRKTMRDEAARMVDNFWAVFDAKGAHAGDLHEVRMYEVRVCDAFTKFEKSNKRILESDVMVNTNAFVCGELLIFADMYPDTPTLCDVIRDNAEEAAGIGRERALAKAEGAEAHGEYECIREEARVNLLSLFTRIQGAQEGTADLDVHIETVRMLKEFVDEAAEYTGQSKRKHQDAVREYFMNKKATEAFASVFEIDFKRMRACHDETHG